ncbi:MAG: MFS transporter [Oscillospiraceae bacterium]|nr:MFS transporter [Oscillospiraceae bacterium]
MSKAKSFHYGWIIVIALSLIRGIAGPALNGSSGLFLTPVSEEIGVGIGQLSLYLSISSVATMLFLPIAGNLINQYSVKTIVILGVALQALSFAGLGFMHSVWGWYILSVPLAMGAVLLVNLLGPVLINRWFVSKKGFVMGIMMTITSLLGAVFQPLLTGLIANTGWRNTYRVFGIAAFVCVIAIALLFLKDKPADKNLKPYGSGEAKDPASDGAPAQNIGVAAKTATKSSAFYLLLLFMVCFTGFVVFSQHIPTFGTNSGLSAQNIGTALSLSMIGSAVGSILIGIFSDKVGIIPTTLFVLGVGAVAICLFLFGGSGFVLFAVATFLHGLATSAIGVVAPLLTSGFFGSKDYEKLFSLVMTGSPLASIVLLPTYGFIYDRMASYRIVLLFILALLAIGAISLLLGFKSSKKLPRENAQH